MNRQFTLRKAFVLIATVCVYLALANQYGFGRAIVCFLVVIQAISSVIFFTASYHSMRDEHPRNALAAFLLGLLILIGSMLLAYMVFQPVSDPADPFVNQL